MSSNMELDLPKVSSFLCCNNIQQDVLSKNYELRGVFQGFGPPGYPFGVEFMTFTRMAYDKNGEFQIDISLYNDKGEKVSDSLPRKLLFGEAPMHDLITAWRIVFPGAGTYSFKVFCNNLNLSEYKVYCR
ncbi:MAG TPA: hypothetical protein VMV05_04470 [bacterium]|nr:hypothetical protein [bacterium]